MSCVLCGLSALTDRNMNISQPRVNSRNCSAYFFVFLFPDLWFHSTLSQVSIQLKILRGLSIDLHGSLFVHLPFFLVL